MTRNKRRHSTGFGYMGFGNSIAVFNRNAKAPFSKIKDQLNTTSLKELKLDFNDKSLSETDKKIIKEKIKSESKRKNTFAIIISIIVSVLVILALKSIIEGILFG